MSGHPRRALLALLLLAACVQRPLGQLMPSRQWDSTLAAAQRAAETGRFAEADSVLARFGRRHADSEDGRETLFWRALFMLDPQNRSASPRDAAVMLERYLAQGGRRQARRHEALALRRVAVHLAEASAARPAGAARPENQDDEIQRLRAELKRTTEELERIKRRLAQPTP